MNARSLNRFLAKVRFDNSVEYAGTPCWIWKGAISSTGYGSFYDGKGVSSHSWSYAEFIGPVPLGLELDHLCRNRFCVNPSHLEPVTRLENSKRGIGFLARQLRATHCPYGHPYAGENLGTHKTHRYCKQCQRDWHRAYYHKQKRAKQQSI